MNNLDCRALAPYGVSIGSIARVQGSRPEVPRRKSLLELLVAECYLGSPDSANQERAASAYLMDYGDCWRLSDTKAKHVILEILLPFATRGLPVLIKESLNLLSSNYQHIFQLGLIGRYAIE